MASGIDSGSAAETRFLLDVMLGKLATYLRMCGYDTAYALDEHDTDPGDSTLLDRAAEESRVLLTRDVSLAKRATRSVLLATKRPLDQLRELDSVGFDISLDEKPARCGVCNGTVKELGNDEPIPEYAPSDGETTLWRCRDCGQVFWRGSHWRDVESRVSEL
ncbi:Mut7-C RNAse domain-containing protein [Haloferax larsenii]|uniref:Mut7-C RNAse domain-containing protein n=1 Tax=Haloferax larsenii TaxID=302484 RepID=A0ABY5RHP1_HALLR|nr:Mut7-C RNAse domain-containing protein [Haloferax larsenii]UVE51861.1 Mut7-C RNAse domain-containing protein [Haloferax larsenii]